MLLSCEMIRSAQHDWVSGVFECKSFLEAGFFFFIAVLLWRVCEREHKISVLVANCVHTISPFSASMHSFINKLIVNLKNKYTPESEHLKLIPLQEYITSFLMKIQKYLPANCIFLIRSSYYTS